MWFKINLLNFSTTHEGFEVSEHHGKKIYGSKGLRINAITDLADREYGQAIVVDDRERTVSFGRDYLGHYPLLFASTEKHLYISDEVIKLAQGLRADGLRVSVSQESLALYFSTGYVPQGLSVFNEIVACSNAAYYQWKNGNLSVVRQFKPVEIDTSCSIADVGTCISEGVKKAAGTRNYVNVWCSGGLDSSSVTQVAYDNKIDARLVTLSYGAGIVEKYGTGEIPFAEEIANACAYPLRHATLDDEQFQEFHDMFARGHISPVIDTCALAKYALASHTDSTAVTGEGGDPIFGGVKNNFMIFSHSQKPDVPLGLLYALSHGRYFEELDKIFVRGTDLKGYVQDFLEGWFDSYPGDLLRKLLLINTFEKQGGIIFAETYYPSKRFGVDIRHPLTSLDVYRTAFKVEDHIKYDYPNGKLLLLDLYQGRLPKKIVTRKKSGTILPIQHYVRRFPKSAFDVSLLKELDVFNEELLDSISQIPASSDLDRPLLKKDALLIYALITLNSWLIAHTQNRAHLST